MVEKFLQRPVLATVFSILIFLVGLLGLASLPITQFPEIAPPMIQVTTNYIGANSEVVLKSVIAPLEEQINGVENMDYMVSTASNDGSATIKIYFTLGTNADMASVNVQSRVSAATSKLPSSVTSYGITTEKSFNSMLLMVSLYSENPAFDETALQNYAKINVYPELQRVSGVGRVSIFGARDFSMRIWLEPERLVAYGLNPSDVISAISEQNIEAAPGKFGDNTGSEFTYTIKYAGKFTQPSEYENIVIKALSDGRMLKIKDVARVELGAFDYSVSTTENGHSAMALAVYQMAGTNARQIVNDIKATLEECSTQFPDGVKYSVPYDTNKFLEASIEQVVHTFIEAFVLVFIVVFVFLQDFRSTLIPGIASLVAIVGTFFFLMLFGFTLNILTLFALVLAIGMVVDDAIVVVEAVHSKMHEGETNVRRATSSAMSEITGAIISITFVMSAVFFPVTFMSGPTGVFYNQFAMTLAVAVIISALNALTLSPVLCILFIKPPKEHGEQKKRSLSPMKKFHKAFNTGFDALTSKYRRTVGFLIRRKGITALALAIFGIGTYWFISVTPTGFIPTEDQGIIFMDVQLPVGAARERTDKVMARIEEASKEVSVITDRLFISGVSLLSGVNGGSYGLGVLSLKDWSERPDTSSDDVIAQLTQLTSDIKDAKLLFFVPPTVSGFGTADGVEMRVQDRTAAGDMTKFYQVLTQFIIDLNKQPEVLYAVSSFSVNFPQYSFTVDVDKCKLMGVNVSDLFTTLQVYYGSAQASDFNRFSKYYRVMVQSIPTDRKDESSLSKMMVRNTSGDMVPITSVVDFTPTLGPQTIDRFNLFVSATINGGAKPGFSTGDVIAAVTRVSNESLPQGYTVEYSGMTREEIKSGGQSTFIFVLCFVFVYLILAAQYESYILPWAVMISLIIGLFGVYFFVWVTGLDNNIYVQVALIMLIGLLAKNGILIVEFALQRRSHGLSIARAAKEGAVARLRPILMTSFAFIFGMIPLIRASGAGANGNVSIGVAAAGGMLVGTLFGVFFIPVLFAVFRHIDERVSPSKVPVITSEPTKE
ncbi:MAG: efflux RND transporter permease subunit [Rikenellaceae bacterium]